MTTQPFKSFILDLLQQGHRDAEAFVQGLTETERATIGTPERWSAKDHLAHQMFWHQDLISKVSALRQEQEVPPREESDDQINAVIFAEHRQRPWADVYAESEQIYADLITLVEQLSEEDMTNTHRFRTLTGERPMYAAFLGGCYEHDQEHLVQYYLDQHDLERATQIREQCTNRVLTAAVPDWVKGNFLYNLACFYSKQHQLEKAAARLQEALALGPHLTEWSKSDPDLSALRADKPTA